MTDSATELVAATDAHFAWLLRGEPAELDGLRQPPGGVDDRIVIEHVRAIARRLVAAGSAASWLIVAAGEVVGLCGHKRPLDTRGAVEIGYNVAPTRRRLGHATRAVGEMLRLARADTSVATLTAQVLVSNVGAGRALRANGFARTGMWTDAREGDVGQWRADARAPCNTPLTTER